MPTEAAHDALSSLHLFLEKKWPLYSASRTFTKESLFSQADVKSNYSQTNSYWYFSLQYLWNTAVTDGCYYHGWMVPSLSFILQSALGTKIISSIYIAVSRWNRSLVPISHTGISLMPTSLEAS